MKGLGKPRIQVNSLLIVLERFLGSALLFIEGSPVVVRFRQSGMELDRPAKIQDRFLEGPLVRV